MRQRIGSVPRIQRHDRQIVVGVAMLWVFLQHRLVEPRGVADSAGALQPHRLLHQSVQHAMHQALQILRQRRIGGARLRQSAGRWLGA